MKISPLEIRTQEFKKSLRGFDETEVQAFLEMLSRQWQEVMDEMRRNEDRIRELESKIDHYQRVEGALQEALNTTKVSSKAAMEDAERRAKLIIQEAKSKAEAMTRSAEQAAVTLKSDTTRLVSRQSEILAKLRAFLSSEMELLDHFEGDRSTLTNEPAEAATNPQAAEPAPAQQLQEVETPTDESPAEDPTKRASRILDKIFGPPAALQRTRHSDDAAHGGQADHQNGTAGERQPLPRQEGEQVTRMPDQGVSEETAAGWDEERARDGSAQAHGHEDRGAGSSGVDEPYNVSDDEIEKIRRILDNLE